MNEYIFIQALATQDSSELFINIDPSLQYKVGNA